MSSPSEAPLEKSTGALSNETLAMPNMNGMSPPSESPLEKSTDAPSDETLASPDMKGTTEWESAMDTVSKLVSEFLARRGNSTPTGRADVVFEGLSVEGSGKGTQAVSTVRTVAESALNSLNPMSYRKSPQHSRLLLRDFSGTVAAGEMLLVIGKPGSGCTTFLKSLSNMRGEYKATSGEVSYGGRSAKHMAKKEAAEIAFCGEEDDHFPTLTVEETLRFAVRSRWGKQASRSEVDDVTMQLAKLVGLDKVLGTQVGNAFVRGVSGGERRRVSLAEVLATCPRILCLDNPTSGLDSSTAVEFLQMMRAFTDQSRCATAMSIYQGSDAIVRLFDKVVVINSGHQVFYGPLSEAKAYFEGLGFVCSPTTTTTDFLNSMSADPEVRLVQESQESKVPRTPADFDSAFRSSPHYPAVQESVRKSKSLAVQEFDGKTVYPLSLMQQIWQCARRQFRVLFTDYQTWRIEMACIVVQSLVLGTLFRNQTHSTQSLFIFASSLFYSVLVPALQSMAEFQNTFAQRSLVLKHKRYQFYRPLAYAFGLVVTDLVWKIVVVAYNIPLYWLTNFQRTPSHFFIWFLTVYVEHICLSMFFRAIAIVSRSMNKAILPVGIFFNCFVLYTGLYVPTPQMQVWLAWFRYCNPLHYAFESVMINEFASLQYSCATDDLAPSGPGYNDIANQVCAVVGSDSGRATLSGASYIKAQYGFETSHLWRNIGINAALFLAMAVCTGIGMEILKLPAGRLATVYYKDKPQEDNEDAVAKSDRLSLMEKGNSDETLRPIAPERSRRSTRNIKDQLDRKGHAFAWKNITLDIKTNDGKKRLLDGMSGWVTPGQMTALMGVSGAGKTTLLNTLAGRLTTGTLTGDLFLGGQPLPRSFSRYMGYVQQQDIHLPTQTVREALQVTARLRRGMDIPDAEKDAYVENVIEMLEMERIADALIGVPGAGLNLEQRKRVTIGVELAAKPEILFLDEPSSGLDGQSALTIILLLRKLADTGQSIICTIHQPAAELVEIFDSLILLVRGGKVAYDGPMGKACSEPLTYLSTHGRPCLETENPAEYFLDVIGAGSRSTVTDDWAQIWQKSETRETRQQVLDQLTSTSPTDENQLSKYSGTYATPFYVQLSVILRRTWFYYWREPDYGTSKLLLIMGNSLLNSMTYLQSADNQRGAYNRVFSAFMALIIGPTLGLQVEPRFTGLREVFMQREKSSLTYHWTIFVVSAIIVELPYIVFCCLVYWLLWYFPVGYFYTPSRAGYSFLMFQLFGVFATSLAQLCAASMPNLKSTFMANGFFFMFCNTFAGTLSPQPVTPKGWKWYYNVSPLLYFGEGVTTNALEGLDLTCTGSEISTFEPPSGTSCMDYAQNFLTSATGYLMNPNSTASCEYCRYKNGQSYYLQYGYEFAHRHRDVGIFIGFIAFNYTFVIAMTYLTKMRQWKKK